MAADLRAGVVGAGVFGRYHAAKYAKMRGVKLSAVTDIHPERAEALALLHGARACRTLDELLTRVDIVSIAAPAIAHAAPALATLAAGRHVYVEKPLATDLEAADAIIAAGRTSHLIVACGFLERAALRAIGLDRIEEAPRRIEAERFNPPAERNLDVSVVLDLMIHDIDLALALGHGEPLAVEATAARVGHASFDEAEAEIDFDDGLTVRLRASRSADIAKRRMRVAYASGEIALDLLAHSLNNTTPYALTAGFAAAPDYRDRLQASLAAFVAAVRGEAAAPMADGVAGARALDLALAVEQAAGG